jgi:hypothetical protein
MSQKGSGTCAFMKIRARTPLLLALSALVGSLLLSSSASAAFPIAKDGKIYACYKAKGKGKGTLRLTRGAKVRCPKKWKKTSWYAAGPTAAVPGAPGPAGQQGAQGPQGEKGATGTAGNVVVEDLEKQVTELLTKVTSLEAILAGVTNTGLKEAIAAVPAVDALCTQADALTDQTTALGSALGSLNGVLEPLLPLFSPVAVPTALTDFECP